MFESPVSQVAQIVLELPVSTVPASWAKKFCGDCYTFILSRIFLLFSFRKGFSATLVS